MAETLATRIAGRWWEYYVLRYLVGKVVGSISDRIIVEVRRAQFTVADVTHHSNGVYFEAGFAMALGRQVIWICRETDFEKLQFDTRQFKHIKWSEPADLRVNLAARIRATIPGAKLA